MAKDRIYCALGYECNNNCLFCAVDSEANRNSLLSNEEILRFFETLKDMKDFEIEISGGEPTCRPELFYFLEHLYENYPQIRYVLLTNGRNFSKATLAAKLSELNPFSALIPLHADGPRLHDQITQSRGSFDETMQGIRNLYDYNVTTGLKTIVTRMNYMRMPELVEMVAVNFPECPGITINGLDVQGKALINKDIVGMRLTDAAPSVEKAIDAAKKYGLNVKIYSIPPCIFGEEYRKFVGVKLRSSVISKTPRNNAHRVKLTYGTVDKCQGCRFFDVCTGAWNTYFDVYGTDEIKPICG